MLRTGKGEMGQRTSMRSRSTASGNMDGKRNGYVGENDLKDINDNDGRRKQSKLETLRNRTPSDCTPSGRYQRRDRTR